MSKLAKLFPQPQNNFLRKPHFWVILFLLAIIGAFYYALQVLDTDSPMHITESLQFNYE